MDDRRILFSGEAQLTAWGESSTTGAWVKMWVHPEDLEAFKLMKLRVGRTAGQRLGLAIVEIGPDEAIVEHAPAQEPPAPPAPRSVPKPSIGEFGMVAVLWCKDRDFWRWASQHFGESIDSEATAKELILHECEVFAKYGEQASRKHLDADPECKAAFNERIRIPFRDWLIAEGIEK